jgi:hypothetical protein
MPVKMPKETTIQAISVDDATEPRTLRDDELTKAMAQAEAREALKVLDDSESEGQNSAEDSDYYPEAPENGFLGPDDYISFITKMNARAVKDYAEFKAHPEKYRLRDPENPDKYIITTVHTCADGRCNPALYSDPSNPLQHLNLDWQPAAGLKYFPEINVTPTCGGIENQLDENPVLKAKIYARLEGMYGPAIRQFLAEHKAGTTSRYFIEQQSHWNRDHYPKHGCGAWDSNLANAQKETIKNAVIVEKWLKESYPEQYAQGLFKIIRTIQDNSVAEEGQDSGDKNHVYDSEYIDSTLTAEEKGEFAGLFDEVKGRFAPPALEDKDKHIVRKYTGNPFKIDTAEHSEQGVRVSKFQWANTLNGQSAMEITWNDADIIAAHNTVLLRIIGDNKFSHANPDKPHYIHLDLAKGNVKDQAEYRKLRNLMAKDEAIQTRLKDGSLFLIVTETDPESIKSKLIKD